MRKSMEYFIGITKEASDQTEITMGKKVEQEHRQTIIDLIKKLRPDMPHDEMMKLVLETEFGIVKDHRKEFDKYYTGLDIMEKELSKSK